MPSLRHHDFGNLYIRFDVKFPEKTQLQMHNLHLLNEVLPPTVPQNPPPIDAVVDDFNLEDVDPRQQARAQGATHLDEDEEDGMPAGAERVQCASQ